MGDAIIRVESLCKCYLIGEIQRCYTLKELLARTIATPLRLFRRPTATSQKATPNHIWALKDVSFEVSSGEVVGIIGRNGSGKSTLFRILSRITQPTKGCAEIHGRVGSLLEVGTGFHSELTGRENIYLNGAILGMKKVEIARKFDEIVAFAGVEKFLDTPVKHYSSGMYMRLAFSVAAHLEPEILLVDEVLAVGDAEFQKQCLGRIGKVAQEGRTVLLVSHNMGAINKLCTRVFWLEAGQVVMSGSAEQVVSRYLTSNISRSGEYRQEDGIANAHVDEIKVYKVRVINDEGTVTSTLDVRKSFFLEIQYRLFVALPYCRAGFLITAADGEVVCEVYDSDDVQYMGRREPGMYVSRCEVYGNLFNVGRYLLSVNIGMPNNKNLAYLDGILSLDIEDTGAVGSFMRVPRQGVIRPSFKWDVHAVQDLGAIHR